MEDNMAGKLTVMNFVISDVQTTIGVLQTQYFLNETPTDADIQCIKENYTEIRRLLQVCNVKLSTGRYQATERTGNNG